MNLSIRALLNKFSATQPALQQTGLPAATAGLAIGDLIVAEAAAAAAYAATTPGNWSGAAPTSVAAALDRVAAALVAAGHTP